MPLTPGARSNPPNRFERIHAAEMPELGYAPSPDDPPEDPRTELLVDPSRTIVATNDSPDLGFGASVNPYRGCAHGCSYCLGPDTPVLYADLVWRPLGGAAVGDELAAFDESPRDGHYARKLRKARVEAVWRSRKPTLRLITRHADLITTAEHRWLPWDSSRWSRTEQLSAGRRLRLLFPAAREEPEDADYRVGYLAGLALEDERRLAKLERDARERAAAYRRKLGGAAALQKLMRSELESASYRRGFLAARFDAEGCSSGDLRFAQSDPQLLQRIRRYGRSLGFLVTIAPDKSGARLVGSIRERMRFLAALRPALRSKLDGVFGLDPVTTAEEIEALEPGPAREVVDIQTSTGTFYASGLATHNCYARPTHEYLGYSAGLDFETKILVKPRAPELLRKKLLSPGWKPQVLALSGVTDCYQPAERRLRITRGCLEVLAEFRNPVTIVTKGFLVTRDVDLLAELARFEAAAVMISITTLDAELQRKMEPLASPPSKRLAAIEVLAKAGVPVGVMAAPVIPGLTDHELPAVLEAAAGAGARSAGMVVLRLPHGVKELFSEWLAVHYPDRKEKVLNRLRALHGGALYDSRYGHRQRGAGEFAAQIEALFQLGMKRAGLAPRGPTLSTAAFRRPGRADQLSLFGLG